MTERVEPFRPTKGNEVKMYTCGPSNPTPRIIASI
jgi:cysteinyl-tRNA synthetase